VAGSYTIVPVMPSGSMLPQGRFLRRTGVPRWTDQRTAPRATSRAYTVSFSVPASTVSPSTSGWPYTAPSSGAVHALRSPVTVVKPGAAPVRALSWWYVVQSASVTAAAALPEGSAAAGAVSLGGGGTGTGVPGSLQPATSSRVTTVRSRTLAVRTRLSRNLMGSQSTVRDNGNVTISRRSGCRRPGHRHPGGLCRTDVDARS